MNKFVIKYKKQTLFTDLILLTVLIDIYLIQGSLGFNIKPIVYLTIFLFFLSDFFKKIENININILIIVFTIIFTHLIAILILNGSHPNYNDSISIFKYLLSYANLFTQLSIAFYVYISFEIEDYIKFIMRLYYVILFLLINHILSNFLFFGSLLTTYEWLSALFAIIVFCYFVNQIFIKLKIIYLIGILVSLFVIIISGLDAALIATVAIIFFLMINSLKNLNFIVKIFIFLFIVIISYYLLIYTFDIYSRNESFLGVLAARAYILVRYLTLLSEYYVFGVGFGASELYFNFSDLSYQNGQLWVDYLKGFQNINVTEEVAKEQARYSDGVTKTSSHNSFLDILIEFGILGSLFILYFCKELFFNLLISKAKLFSNYQMFNLSNLILVGLSVFYFFLSMIQFYWMFLIFFAFVIKTKSGKNDINTR